MAQVLAQLFASLPCCNAETYAHEHTYSRTHGGCRHGAKYLITVILNVILFTGIQTFSRELRSMTGYKPGLSDATNIMLKHFTAGTNCNRFSQWEAVLKEKLNLGHNNVKYYVPVRVEIAIDFRRRPKGFYPSERRLVWEISWIISEVSGLLSSSVIFARAAPLSIPAVHTAGYLRHLSFKLTTRPPPTWHVTRLCPFVWFHVVSCAQVRCWRTGPIRWLMATLYWQLWEGSCRVNLSSPLYANSQSALPHWPFSSSEQEMRFLAIRQSDFLLSTVSSPPFASEELVCLLVLSTAQRSASVSATIQMHKCSLSGSVLQYIYFLSY